MSRAIVLVAAICLFATISSAQSSPTAGHLLGDGISFRGGLGHLALRDEYISGEEYSGSFPSFGVSWLQGDSSSAYRLGFDYAGSSDIRNNNVSAQVMQSGLNLDFLNSVGRFSFLSHDVFAYVGPSAEISLYYRQQRIATGGNALFNAYSFAFFFSLSANSTLAVPLSSDVSVESSARLALLSMGARLADLHDQSVSFVKAVTAFSGLRGHLEFLLDYDLNDRVCIKTGYRFEIFQSSSWSYLLSASDNVVLVVTVNL